MPGGLRRACDPRRVSPGARAGSRWSGGAEVADIGEEVIATSTVRDLAVGSMLRFDPRGTRELKGVPGSWSVFAVDEAA